MGVRFGKVKFGWEKGENGKCGEGGGEGGRTRKRQLTVRVTERAAGSADGRGGSGGLVRSGAVSTVMCSLRPLFSLFCSS